LLQAHANALLQNSGLLVFNEPRAESEASEKRGHLAFEAYKKSKVRGRWGRVMCPPPGPTSVSAIVFCGRTPFCLFYADILMLSIQSVYVLQVY